MATIRTVRLKNGNIKTTIFDESKMVPAPEFTREYEFGPLSAKERRKLTDAEHKALSAIQDPAAAEAFIDAIPMESDQAFLARQAAHVDNCNLEALRSYAAEFAGPQQEEQLHSAVVNINEV